MNCSPALSIMRWCFALASISLLFAALPNALAADPAGVVLLKSRCVTCHNSQTAQGKLDLSGRESALRGGERGAAIRPGNARESFLYQLASHQVQPFMPMAGAALSQDELKTLAAWIDSGAPWLDEGTSKTASSSTLFASVVKPMFEHRCAPCHGAGGRKTAGLDVSTHAALLKGGDDGPVIDLKSPESSPLIARLRQTAKPGMPYNQPQLAGDIVDKVVEW